jgi:hypothetical protein
MLEQTFDEIFTERCREARVPATCRTEAIRLEMLRSLRLFLQQPLLERPRETLTEQEFELALTPDLTIRGRIDRIDLYRGRQAMVIDYKYAASYRMREYLAANEEEQSVQAGLYLLAARQVFKLNPVGMLYCTLRRDVKWGGWHLHWPGGGGVGESCTPEVLAELAERAAAASIEVARAIRHGRIEPAPANLSICARCDFADICRVETHALVSVAGGSSE